jgi:enoyl-CoA hydratase/carnithine racemase
MRMTAPLLSFRDDTAVLELNRPERLNAIDEATAAELGDALARLRNANPRAVVLLAAGRAFCAGRDVTDVDPADDDAHKLLDAVFNPLVQAVYDLPMPTFAAVHGACLGAGLGLALACDVVYAAEDAKIGSPFAQLGAVLDSGAHAFLSRRVGPARALELIYTGRLLDGREAARLGLVDQALPRPALRERVFDLAMQVAVGPTAAFAESKRIVHALADAPRPLARTLADEADAQGRASRTADYREGFAAFQQKRQPRFIGR